MPPAPSHAAPVRVALVEDEHDIRDNWLKLLGSFRGFTSVGHCASGEDALELLPTLRPQIVLMDIFLPRMSGIECASRLKELLPGTHILMLASVEESSMVFQALRPGADRYLLKSTSSAKLRAPLRDLLNGGAPMTGAVAQRVVQYFQQKNKPTDANLGLSAREEEVLILLSKGYGNKEIAAQVALSIDTVSTYLKQIYKKLHVHSRTEAVLRYTQSKVN
jgi:DNA-binding NarL/FixJ family response regulator